MPVLIQRPSGLRILVPEAYTLVESRRPVRPKPRATQGLPRGLIPLPTGPTPEAMERAGVVDALRNQGLELVDDVSLEPRAEPSPIRGVRGPGAAAVPAAQQLELELDVASDEHAVVLLEQFGVYSWNYLSIAEPSPQQTAGHGTRGKATGKRVRCEVVVHSSRPTSRTSDRTLITDAGLGYLRCLGSLRDLEIWFTRVTEAGIAAVRKDMPEVRIDYQLADDG